MKFDAKKLRKTVLEMSYAGSSVHIPSAFSIIEILAVLYRSHLHFKDGNPNDPNRDYLIMSKGHGIMAQYACLYELGWIKDSDIKNYFKDGTLLKGLSDAEVPGVEANGGSLGHALSVGVGLALGIKLKNSKQKVYTIVGDGELNEGTIWEALLFSAHFKLSNLIVIVDKNDFQAMGPTDEILNLGNIEDKFKAFGFETCSINGHDEIVLEQTIHKLTTSTSNKPKAIIAQTVKGKGVSFMEHNNTWHYTRLTPDTFNAALLELNS